MEYPPQPAPVKYADCNGVRLAYLEQGQGPLVICLHGFPDSAHSFDHLTQVLVDHGYRVVAPFLRGYYPSGLAADNDYSMPAVAADVLALIEQLGETQASLIGHDWGGIAAYTAANISPQKIKQLIVLAVPHMNQSRFSWAQLKKSWYVLFFQLPWLPERVVARNNFAFIDCLYRHWSPSWSAAEYKLAPVKRSLGFAGGVKAALAYYRAMIRGSKAEHREVMSRQTNVPSLWIVGEEDGSVGIDQFQGIEQAFSGDFDLLRVAGAGHFVHREAAELVHNKILSKLSP